VTAVINRTVKWRGTIALAAVVLLATGIGQISFGHALLGRAGLFQPPASYTSLSFQNPASLPGPLTPGSAVRVSFAIHNTGGASRLYQWSVTAVQGSQRRQLAAGTVTVAADHGISVNPTARVSCTAGQLRIVVSLAHPAESIDAWTACPSPGKRASP
jgi:hypothetical protein